jgi:branched-chain amino acid transport system substrate-binding protein
LPFYKLKEATTMIKRFSYLLNVITFIIVSTNLSAQQTIKVAIAAPTTGANAHNGELLIKGVQLAITELNKSGKLQFQSSVFDDACETDQANDVANEIVNQGFRFVIGHLCSNATMVASSIYQEEGLILMSPASTAQGITTRGYDSVFRSVYLDSQQGVFAAQFIQDNYLSKKIPNEQILILHNNDVYGKSIANELNKTLSALASNTIHTQGLTPSPTALNSLIKQINDYNIKVIYFAAFSDQMLTLMQTINDAELKIQLIGTNALNDEWFISQVKTTKYQSILYTDAKENQAELPALSAQSYAAMQSLAAALNSSHSSATTDIIKKLQTLTTDSIIGQLSWAKNGDLNTHKNAFNIVKISAKLK